MEVLQQEGYGVLGKSAFTPGFALDDPSMKESVRVAATPRTGSLKVTSRHFGLRDSSGGLIQRHIARSVTARAALLRGLGGSLKEGYVLRNHGIVNEHTAVESTGDVIEKLKKGFKNFKKTQYKCVFLSPPPSYLFDQLVLSNMACILRQ